MTSQEILQALNTVRSGIWYRVGQWVVRPGGGSSPTAAIHGFNRWILSQATPAFAARLLAGEMTPVFKGKVAQYAEGRVQINDGAAKEYETIAINAQQLEEIAQRMREALNQNYGNQVQPQGASFVTRPCDCRAESDPGISAPSKTGLPNPGGTSGGYVPPGGPSRRI